jgi:hypothetical protein
MTYSEFTQKVLALSTQNLSSDEIAKEIGELMEKEPLELLPFVQQVLLKFQVIHVR